MPVGIKRRYAECYYAECHDYLNIMLSVIIPNVIMLSAVMLSVVAPFLLNALAYFAMVEIAEIKALLCKQPWASTIKHKGLVIYSKWTRFIVS
jgi:hypothetical protein